VEDSDWISGAFVVMDSSAAFRHGPTFINQWLSRFDVQSVGSATTRRGANEVCASKSF